MSSCVCVSNLPPTTLAFVGDAVQTLYVRKRLALESDCVCGTLHTAASEYVNAVMQAHVFDELVARGVFSEEELDTARRARNAHVHSRSKASQTDYHKATALEAIIGMLELTQNTARRDELLDLFFSIADGLKKPQN